VKEIGGATTTAIIVLKALVFPWINILWAGCVIMIIGTVMAIRRRVKLG